MRQLTVVCENKPGVLADVAGRIGAQGVNIEAITAETFGEGAVIRVVTNDPSSAKSALEAGHYKVSESEILVVGFPDRPGEIAKIAKKLGASGVNIENIYLLNKRDGEMQLALKVSDLEKARKTIGRENLR